MNPIEDIYTIDDYRIEVRPTRYNPVQRANQHSVRVFSLESGVLIGVGTVNSARRSYTNSKAIDIIHKVG